MIKVSQSRTQDEYRRQFFFISLVVVFSFFLLVLRLWYLQILNGEKWLRFSESNRIEAKRIPAIRGRILDREGKVIADSQPSFDLKIVPGQLRVPVDEMVHHLQKILHWSDEESLATINKIKAQNKHDYFAIKQGISKEEIALIMASQFRLTGVKVIVVPARRYIYAGLGSHLLGYLGEVGKKELQVMKEQDSEEYGIGEFWGLTGVEKAYEPFLKGMDGIEPVIEDVWGREVKVEGADGLLPSFQARQDKEGLDVVLTIDLDLQILAERMLLDKRGSVIAMDPRSGEILAMASSPSFEPEEFARGVNGTYWRKVIMDPEKPLYNRSVQGTYAPASTFKAIMAAAILQEKVSNPNERIFCPGYYRIGREVKRCWKHEGHGYMNLKEAIQHSCDVYFYEMGRRLGIERIAKYAREFGLGEKTGYPLSPSEEKGLVPTTEWKKKVYKQPWVEGETLSVAIGQGALSTTPLQMAVAYSAIANGGTLIHPIPALRAQTFDGKLMKSFETPENNRSIDIEKPTLDKVREGLMSVVNEPGGTAYATVRSKFVRIAGKTGTAQTTSRKSGIKSKDNAWFIGYAPEEDPEILVAAVVEEGLHGSSAAGPIAKIIIEKYISKKEGFDETMVIPSIEPIKSEKPKKAASKIEKEDSHGDEELTPIDIPLGVQENNEIH